MELAWEADGKFGVGGEDGGVGLGVAGGFEELGEGGVRVHVRFETHAVGWVGDDEGRDLEGAEESDIGVLEVDGEVGGGSGGAAGFDGFEVAVAAEDGVGLYILFLNRSAVSIEFGGVVVGVFEEAPGGAEVAGRSVRGHHGGFPKDGAGAAVRVAEDVFGGVAGVFEDGGGKRLLEGCFDGGDPVAPFEEGCAGGVEADGRFIFVDEEVELDGGVSEFDGGAISCFFAEVVADGVFDDKASKMAVFKPFGDGDVGVDSKGGVDGEPFVPFDGKSLFIECFAVCGGEEFEGPQDAGGQARFVVDAVDILHRRFDGGATRPFSGRNTERV